MDLYPLEDVLRAGKSIETGMIFLVYVFRLIICNSILLIMDKKLN